MLATQEPQQQIQPIQQIQQIQQPQSTQQPQQNQLNQQSQINPLNSLNNLNQIKPKIPFQQSQQMLANPLKKKLLIQPPRQSQSQQQKLPSISQLQKTSANLSTSAIDNRKVKQELLAELKPKKQTQYEKEIQYILTVQENATHKSAESQKVVIARKLNCCMIYYLLTECKGYRIIRKKTGPISKQFVYIDKIFKGNEVVFDPENLSHKSHAKTNHIFRIKRKTQIDKLAELIQKETGIKIVFEGTLNEMQFSYIEDKDGNAIDLIDFLSKYQHEDDLHTLLLHQCESFDANDLKHNEYSQLSQQINERMEHRKSIKMPKNERFEKVEKQRKKSSKIDTFEPFDSYMQLDKTDKSQINEKVENGKRKSEREINSMEEVTFTSIEPIQKTNINESEMILDEINKILKIETSNIFQIHQESTIDPIGISQIQSDSFPTPMKTKQSISMQQSDKSFTSTIQNSYINQKQLNENKKDLFVLQSTNGNSSQLSETQSTESIQLNQMNQIDHSYPFYIHENDTENEMKMEIERKEPIQIRHEFNDLHQYPFLPDQFISQMISSAPKHRKKDSPISPKQRLMKKFCKIDKQLFTQQSNDSSTQKRKQITENCWVLFPFSN